MTSEQLKELQEEIKVHVAQAVRTTVNGKIDALSSKLQSYIVADEAWKERAEPVVRAFENSSWLFKVFIGAMKVVAIVGGGIAAVFAIKSYFK